MHEVGVKDKSASALWLWGLHFKIGTEITKCQRQTFQIYLRKIAYSIDPLEFCYLWNYFASQRWTINVTCNKHLNTIVFRMSDTVIRLIERRSVGDKYILVSSTPSPSPFQQKGTTVIKTSLLLMKDYEICKFLFSIRLRPDRNPFFLFRFMYINKSSC